MLNGTTWGGDYRTCASTLCSRLLSAFYRCRTDHHGADSAVALSASTFKAANDFLPTNPNVNLFKKDALAFLSASNSCILILFDFAALSFPSSVSAFACSKSALANSFSFSTLSFSI